jgi:hypothetical protein
MLLEHPEVNLENARRTHHEYYAPALVNSWWLRLFASGALLALLLLGIGGLRTAKQIAKQRVVILTEARDGSFDRVQYVNMADFLPDDKVIKHFAFVWAEKYYSRVRATISTDYPESLQFFAPEIVTELRSEADQSHWVRDFQDSNEAEIRIVLRKIRLDSAGEKRGIITVDFERHFYLGGREVADKTENVTAQVPYELLPTREITNGMIPVNPIGLKLTSKPLETKGF